MDTKIPKYTGKRFVKPFSRNVGRRTGRNVRAGKNIRIKEDGFEDFDDYMSESDADLTRENVLMRSIREESQSSEDSSKENIASQANQIVSQSVPSQSTFYNSVCDSTVSQSQLSQGAKVNNRSRFAWLRNRNIGRRTGKDVRSNKQIRKDEDGFEVFDDYLSPPSSTESFLSASTISESLKSSRRKSGLAITQETRTEGHVDDDSQPSSQASAELSSHSSQEHVNETVVQADISRSNKNPDRDLRDEGTQTFNSPSLHESDSQSSTKHRRDTISRQIQVEHLDNLENDDNDDKDSHMENLKANLSVNSDLNGVNDSKRKSIGSKHQSVIENDNKDRENNEIEDGDDIKDVNAHQEDGQENFVHLQHLHLHCNSEDEDCEDEQSDLEAEQSDPDDSDHSYNNPPDPPRSHEVKEKSEQMHKRQSISIKSATEDNSDSELSESDNYTETVGHADEPVLHLNERQQKVSEDSANNSEDLSDRSVESHSENDIGKQDQQVSVLQKDTMVSNKSSGSDNRSQRSVGSRQTLESNPVVPDDSENESDSDGSYNEDKKASPQLSEEDESNDNTVNDELVPASQTGIDVAGNRSGSITKLDIPVPDTSKVSFDRTRKRLSYSALELSDEAKKARRSRLKEANQDFTKDMSSTPACKSTMQRSLIIEDHGQNKVNVIRRSVSSSKSDGTELNDNRTKTDSKKAHTLSGRMEASGEYYEPSELVCLASVAKRRSVYVASKDVDSDDDIDILDDIPKKKGTRKSMVVKIGVSKSKTVEKKTVEKKLTKTSKSTVKSKRNVKSLSDKETAEEVNDEANVKMNGTKQSVTKLTSQEVRVSLHENYSDHENNIDVTDMVPKQKTKRKSVYQKKVDLYDIENDESLNVANNKEPAVEDRQASEKRQTDKKKVRQRKSILQKTIEQKQKVKRKSVNEKNLNVASTNNDLSDEDHTRKELDKDSVEQVHNNIHTDNKKTRRGKSTSKKSATRDQIKSNKRLERKSAKFDPNDIHDDPTKDDTDNESLYMEENFDYNMIDDVYINNTKEKSVKSNMKVNEDTVNNESETRIRTAKIAEEINSDPKKIIKKKAKAARKTIVSRTKELNVRKSQRQRNVRTQSLTRNSKLKSLNSNTLGVNKRKLESEKQKETNEKVDTSTSKIKKAKSSESDSQTDSEKKSLKRKLDFKKKVRPSKPSQTKIDSLDEDEMIPNDDIVTPDQDQVELPCVGTPIPNSLLNATTNFNSGVSIRVARRSEMLEKISSGYGDVPKFSVQMLPTEGLTPCIAKKGRSRSKGRRVTICQETTENNLQLDADQNMSIERRKPSLSRKSSVGTPLPRPSTSPVHYCEMTHTSTPGSRRESLGILEDRLIHPAPAPNGLRRSKRTRLKPIASHKTERIVYDRSDEDGWRIIGVKPSLEVKHAKMEEEKHRRRLLLNQIRKASQKHKEKKDRKLSIHVELPQDAHPIESTSEISVVDAEKEDSLLMECIGTKDSRKPVGPHHGSPKKDDPYLIKKLIEQPIMSVGHLIIKAGEEKPPQLVDNHAVIFMIHYGKLLVTIHNTTSLLETGDTFFVPYGNSYSIKNLRHDTATLFYTVLKVCEINNTVVSDSTRKEGQRTRNPITSKTKKKSSRKN